VRKKKEKNQQKKNKNYVDPEKLVVSEPIEITQEFCYFDFASPWEQIKKKACEKLQKGMGNNENKRREESYSTFLMPFRVLLNKLVFINSATLSLTKTKREG
jgi:hypothetical protein